MANFEDKANQMEPLNVPGAINSLRHEGCLATIGCVVASMSKETLQALVNAFAEIERKMTLPNAVITTDVESGHGWTSIGFAPVRQTYSLNLRGVCWEVSRQEMDCFIRHGAIPFLARGTMSKLLCGISGLI